MWTDVFLIVHLCTWDEQLIRPLAIGDVRVYWRYFSTRLLFHNCRTPGAVLISETGSKSESSKVEGSKPGVPQTGIDKPRHLQTQQAKNYSGGFGYSLPQVKSYFWDDPDTERAIYRYTGNYARLGLGHTAKLLLYWLGLFVCFTTLMDLGTAMPYSPVCSQLW